MPRKITPIICVHTNRIHYGLGLCESCYQIYRLHINPRARELRSIRVEKYKVTHKDALINKRKSWAQKNPERQRRIARRASWKNMGLDPDACEKVLASANSICEACGYKFEKLHLDHNHNTNHIRGALCGHCNRGLGLFFDDTKRLQGAINYLNTFNGKSGV